MATLIGKRTAVLIYNMPGHFFVELTYDTDANEVQYLFRFAAGG